jgi:hypothetical protein
VNGVRESLRQQIEGIKSWDDDVNSFIARLKLQSITLNHLNGYFQAQGGLDDSYVPVTLNKRHF